MKESPQADKEAKEARIRVDAGRVDVDESMGEGRNTPRYWVNNKWEFSDPTFWIRLDGEWYLDCRESRKVVPEQGKQ